ncbi:hypothetical protein [Actinomycetospora sp. NBRC 106378]|uniref:LGFP repeat-containing protein n=1 Tax=Actinomycetospora sp. NBRC 106378 TaxID=3032208 RepID=UPI00255423AD|nr:hypothetical protein [Actinomycetospora sp. NBRC 106378]
MRLCRAAVISTFAIAVVAGVVALVAATVGEDVETFADGFDPTVSHTLRGPVLERYRAEGGPAGPLGLPLSDESPTTFEPMTSRGADREVGFRHGAIYLDSQSGHTWFGVWYAYLPPDPIP